MRSSEYGLGLAVAASCMAFGAASASAAKVQVLPSDINSGGAWTQTLTGTGTGVAETGPRVPPLGTGSYEFTTADNGAKVELFNTSYMGTLLSAVQGIGYSTFRDPAATDSGVVRPSIQIPIDVDGDFTTPGFSTLVYQPYVDQNAAPLETNEWQNWDAFNPAGANPYGGWYATGTTGTNTGCLQGSTCTLAFLQSQLMDAKMYKIGLNQGSNNGGGKANADALYVTLTGQDQTTFDFESQAGPTGPAGTDGTPGARGPAGTTGAQGPTGTSGVTPSSTTTKTKKVVVASKSLTLSKKSRKSVVQVTCPRSDGLCEGTIKIVYKGKVIARQAFLVRGARSGKFTVRLSKSNLRKIGKSKRVAVNVFSRDLTGAASNSSKKVTLKTGK